MLLPPGVPVIPEHELLRPIASGAYGQVWLARNRLGVYRAVKIVHRASFDHDRPFEREFAGIKTFEPISRSHEGFVNLLQVGRDDAAGYFYYVMELADHLNAEDGGTDNQKLELRNPNPTRAGGNGENAEPALQHSSTPALQDPSAYVPRTLASELKSPGRLPLQECIRIGLSLTDALSHLHRQGLVHRDVKPSNIIFVHDVPKLADVGLVTGMSEARSFVGTEGFIAPEGPGTPQADLYSLGIVLYVISTGKSHQDFPEPPPELTSNANRAQLLEFEAVIHKACQVNVRDRFRTADAMHSELMLLDNGQSVRRKRAVRRRWVAAKNLALALVTLIVGYLALTFLKGAKPAHSTNQQALRLYERGRWYYNQLTPQDHAKAYKDLTEAAQADPKFAQPYGELVALYGWSMMTSISNELQRLEAVRGFANKVKAIDPNLAQAHTAESFCHFLERDWRGAEQEILRAIKADPEFAIAHFVYCFYLSLQGRTAEAEREGQRAQALEPPESLRVSAIAAAWPFMADRRFDRAIAQLQKVMELDRNFATGHGYIADCYEAQSNSLAAIEEYRLQALLSGQDAAKVAEIFGSLKQAYETQGEQACLRRWVEVLLADEALPEDKQMFSDRSNTDLAGYYARLGEKQKALDDLEKHFDEPNVWSQIKFLPMYDSLHQEERFKALVRRAGLDR